ncbi:hypothetical protein PCNPT3_11530 [Psychromonas sp. CNPT3]|uniref:hypothetical protein n=1 Tax=Psychromonas sp. CNPT3 TaxID=314282 RepID=UPI00006E38E5|nr:hypothetical protein [Psychromonas sp. CNPT3]AGH82242.1 hypothetical protein PCNPT3_11530 [Psychromonas sp. CNPT3]
MLYNLYCEHTDFRFEQIPGMTKVPSIIIEQIQHTADGSPEADGYEQAKNIVNTGTFKKIINTHTA